METIQAPYDEVYVYAMGRPSFILQYVVDAAVVQTATIDTKPIAIVFGLVGLYLHIEKQFSGRQVQQAHMNLARTKREWPNLHLPDNRGGISANLCGLPASQFAKPSLSFAANTNWSSHPLAQADV